jgi:hypothetical protein
MASLFTGTAMAGRQKIHFQIAGTPYLLTFVQQGQQADEQGEKKA